MTHKYYRDSQVLRRLHEGPLGPHIDGFAEYLSQSGYAPFTARYHLRLVGKLSLWLEGEDLKVCALEDQRLEEFLQERRGKRQLRAGDGAILYTLLEQLGAAGVVRLRKAQPPNSPFDRIERRFTVYLEQDRGLASATVGKYLAGARRFLRERFGAEAIKCAEVNSRDVSGFVLRHACEHTPKGAQLMITSLRAFLRFLYLCGETKTNLAAALLAVAQWPMATLPKSLEPEQQVESVLAHCERHKAGGQRDYAILLLLARVGLRAGEVVGLTLDDINWDAGELTIRAKVLATIGSHSPRKSVKRSLLTSTKDGLRAPPDGSSFVLKLLERVLPVPWRSTISSGAHFFARKCIHPERALTSSAIVWPACC